MQFYFDNSMGRDTHVPPFFLPNNVILFYDETNGEV